MILVLASSGSSLSTTIILPSRFFKLSAESRASLRALRGMRIRIIPRLWSKSGTAADPDRRPYAAGAGSTRAFLTPRFFSTAAHEPFRFGRRATRPAIGELHHDSLMQKVRARFCAKYFFFKLGLNNVDFHAITLSRTPHNRQFPVWPREPRPCTSIRLFSVRISMTSRFCARNLLIAPVTRHFFSFADSAGIRTVTDGTAMAKIFMGAVGSRKSSERPSFDYPSEPMPFRGSGDIDAIASLEQVC